MQYVDRTNYLRAVDGAQEDPPQLSQSPPPSVPDALSRSLSQHADRASDLRGDHRAEEDPDRHGQGTRREVLHHTHLLIQTERNCGFISLIPGDGRKENEHDTERYLEEIGTRLRHFLIPGGKSFIDT